MIQASSYYATFVGPVGELKAKASANTPETAEPAKKILRGGLALFEIDQPNGAAITIHADSWMVKDGILTVSNTAGGVIAAFAPNRWMNILTRYPDEAADY